MFKLKWSKESNRYWQAFRGKPSAYYSAIILSILFFVSLFADFYANSKPILAYYEGKFYFPQMVEYPETTFGGIFETEADYSDPFIKELFDKEGNWAIYPPIQWDYKTINFSKDLQHPSPPSSLNLLGTDNRGRDVLSRLIYGFRISLIFGIILAFIDAFIGIIIGAIEGFFGGKIDIICQRLIEVWASIPFLYALILVASVFDRSIILMVIILSLFGWIAPQALVRIEFLKSRNLEYVKAARALGVGNLSIMARHILPNALTIVVTRLPFSIAGSMTALVSLDFLNLGVPPPTPSLGESLNQGLASLSSWWIGISTISVIFLVLLLVTFIGQAILDIFDPKRR